jgi:uncharacterized protein YydD (DUF2326 family)
MIRRIWSDLPTFRTVEFTDGMNIVLADTNADSEETESTNGLGKSTLLRIIHFCLGSDLARDKTLSHSDLYGVIFSLSFASGGINFEVHRSTASSKVVSVSADFVTGLPIEIERAGELAVISVEEWRYALSARFLPEGRLPGEILKFSPNFRDISYYLVRLGKEAFAEPQTAFRGQSGLSRRVDTSFLLGLNWPVQRQLHILQEARKSVGAALKAVADAAQSDNDRGIGDLEADRVLLEKALAAREKEISEFNLREDYHDLEIQLQAVDLQIHELVNDNFSDGRLLAYYQESAQDRPCSTPTSRLTSSVTPELCSALKRFAA